MDTSELEHFLRLSKCDSKKIQVLACDQLPTGKCLPIGSTVIANLSPISSNGSHWCLFHTPSVMHPDFHCGEKTLLWFDSLGIVHRDFYPQFAKFLKNYTLLLSNDGSPVQEVDRYSESCGMFCLYVATKLCEGSSFQRILSEFDTCNLNFNECMILERLNNRFKTDKFNKYEGCRNKKE